jgi:hypothetical protein
VIRKGRKRAEQNARDPEAPPPSLGRAIVEWQEHYLVHGVSPAVQGLPYKLHDDLVLLNWLAYEMELGRDGHWKRRYKEVVFTGPKGTAKSEHQAAMCCVEALGPVVFDGFDANGEPVGIERLRSRIDVYGGSVIQAGNTFMNVAFMLNQSDDGEATQALRDDYPGIDIGNSVESSSRIVLPDNRGKIEPRGGRPGPQEGGIPTTFAAIEELHEWKLPAQHSLYGKVRRQMRKVPTPGGWLMNATNLYGPGEGSMLELVDKDRKTATDLLWFQNSADPNVITASTVIAELPYEVLMAQLKLAYGSATWNDLDGLIDEMQRSSTDDADALRFYFNIASTVAGKWMRAKAWDLAKRDVKLEDGDIVAFGFDGSRANDATAIVVCRLSDKALFLWKSWERPPNLKEWRIDPAEVEDAIVDLRARMRVVRGYLDPPQWQTEIQKWEKDFGSVECLPDEEHLNGRDIPVVYEWWTGRPKQMAMALERFHTSITEATPTLVHDGSEVLRKHVLNAIRIDSRFGDVIGKGRPIEYIDGAVAAVLAHEGACDAIAEGCVPKEHDNSIYDTEGITWLD